MERPHNTQAPPKQTGVSCSRQPMASHNRIQAPMKMMIPTLTTNHRKLRNNACPRTGAPGASACGSNPQPSQQTTWLQPSTLTTNEQCMWLQISTLTTNKQCTWLQLSTLTTNERKLYSNHAIHRHKWQYPMITCRHWPSNNRYGSENEVNHQINRCIQTSGFI